jgi:transcriptional regulator with PAS, ATPase and Fis domain
VKASKTVAEKERAEGARSLGLSLHVALCGEQPLLGGRTFDLGGVTEVTIGRGAPLAIGPGENDGSARLDLPDQTVSSRHARLVLAPDARATLEDLGSRNGTRVRGERTARAQVGAGDWFVIGRTVLLLRASAPNVAAEAQALVPGSTLRTFSPIMTETFQKAAALAPSTVPLLIVADTGTGKEVLAHEIHRLSRRPGRIVAVNCAALPETLVESELFGYRKGAFSDAREDRPGLVRAAEGGTLLLDEIGDLPLGSQAKLLRVLQEGEVLALGATSPVRVDVRVIAATQRRLDELVETGRFRADLLGRLAGYTLSLLPLRLRLEDVGLLVATLLARHAGADATKFRLTSEACVALFRRSWPLNVRELDRTLQSAVVLAHADKEIGVDHIGGPPGVGVTPEENEAEQKLRERLVESLTRHRGNISAVARELGKARMQIHRWMNQLGIDPRFFRPPGGEA